MALTLALGMLFGGGMIAGLAPAVPSMPPMLLSGSAAVVAASLGGIDSTGGVRCCEPDVLVASFCAYALFRTFLFSSAFAYVGQRFGDRHYGALCGVLFLCSALGTWTHACFGLCRCAHGLARNRDS